MYCVAYGKCRCAAYHFFIRGFSSYITKVSPLEYNQSHHALATDGEIPNHPIAIPSAYNKPSSLLRTTHSDFIYFHLRNCNCVSRRESIVACALNRWGIFAHNVTIYTTIGSRADCRFRFALRDRRRCFGAHIFSSGPFINPFAPSTV